MSLADENMDEEPEQSFMDSTECLVSDRGSRLAEPPDSDDDRDDIGDALARGAMESESRHTSAYLSQRMPHHKYTEMHFRRRSTSMSPGYGTPTGRINAEEDEDLDIYGDGNVGPFYNRHPGEESDTAHSRHDLEDSPVRSWEYSDLVNGRTTIPPSDDEESLGENNDHYQMDETSSEASSRQGVDATVNEEDIILFDEPSTSRERVSSSGQRMQQAMAIAARQTNTAWRSTFREHSEEVDELL
ncbi:hypothetical protein FVEG_08476 [Fusarium verticillioides 7600]|uniref:Uncharacterized protein n=1 Tax=Gibberella moniliformis (strain M3125 / FGSC 7600) TaxID=334819 RepID=W7MM17_GIBM7|nr:hypothetical protein FVEG_08476 [Fusarium verticillioides 7600]EWG48814.1 hypothetical protein FVEG_08476 [Fusarium verticillioides 7600]